MEACLDLNRHRPGTLPRLATYLHTRTGGRIGSLARLLRQAAITTAILDSSERITKTALEAITLDHLAEETSRARYPAKRTTTRRPTRHGTQLPPTPERPDPARPLHHTNPAPDATRRGATRQPGTPRVGCLLPRPPRRHLPR